MGGLGVSACGRKRRGRVRSSDRCSRTHGLLRRRLGDGAIACAPDVEACKDGGDHEEGPIRIH